MTHLVYHLVLNNCVSDGRVLKSAAAAAQSGAKVVILAFWEDGLPETEERANFTITRVKVPPKKSGMVQTWLWLRKVEAAFMEQVEPAAIFHCHDLFPVGMALRIRDKKSPKAKIIYDAHELETELECLSGLRKKIFQWIERRIIYKVDRMITVGDRIADWYVERYSVERPVVVRNIPELVEHQDESSFNLREHFKIPDEDIVFLYLGAFHYARGIPLMLSVFERVRKDRHLVFVGSGEHGFEKLIIEHAEANDNIHRRPPVPLNDVVATAEKADIGISFTEPVCLNNIYALPNKFFQSLQAGRALWIFDSPEQADILRKYDAGWIASGDLEEMVHWVDHLEKASVRKKQANAAGAATELTWEHDANRVTGLYKELGVT